MQADARAHHAARCFLKTIFRFSGFHTYVVTVLAMVLARDVRGILKQRSLERARHIISPPVPLTLSPQHFWEATPRPSALPNMPPSALSSSQPLAAPLSPRQPSVPRRT